MPSSECLASDFFFFKLLHIQSAGEKKISQNHKLQNDRVKKLGKTWKHGHKNT